MAKHHARAAAGFLSPIQPTGMQSSQSSPAGYSAGVGVQIGNYELIDLFATGGVAQIYRARHVRSGAVVVIKRRRSDIPFDPDLLAGFDREMQLGHLACHKNLIRTVEIGLINGEDYGVMEYVDGKDLGQIVQRVRQRGVAIPLSFATFIVAEILDGLSFAHAMGDPQGRPMGLVHRDLAPKNVLIGYDGTVKVVDFGLAIATQTERVAAIVGTPGYLSPEQARGEQLDARSDLFAAGCILFELATGHSAFDVDGKKDSAALKVFQRGAIRRIPGSVPEQLRLVIEIATAPNREDRYRTASDMLRALHATESPPDDAARLGVAALVRGLFAAEFQASRLPPST